ncbi:MAG: hypothetical protein L0J74_13205 [Corynebacterium sp.]|uniref:hypothetical protein n=1 Tax=Corynebacterium sp. TaxID=1720 RepID=UPI0026492DB6|nr:hypothetical protein [Corynebacterium sp.]MDN6282384.1 hypothetical protein [Corynebacterium sp.]MDN6306732.1 hypothetical protein [Corynebacterium sp.]MDN6366994.1 hypothetical protein [Corynebacterium sp.]MDN6376589.1 hypothetical protein [Corynebacterium sp.]MDN6396807.1 hypothetical protein [Corynebacterium sp.]
MTTVNTATAADRSAGSRTGGSVLSRAVVPIVAATTTVLVGVVQLAVLMAWGSHRDMAMRDVLLQWDSLWMTMISEHGYSGFVMSAAQSDPVQWESVAFFPGYPVLLRIVAAPLAVLNVQDATYLAAVMLSGLCAVLMTWGVARLALGMWSQKLSRPVSDIFAASLTAAVGVLVAGAPMGIVYWMPYSESLFGALTVWALVFLLRQRYLLAGLLVLGAGLTRLTAVTLVVVLCAVAVCQVWRYWRSRRSEGAEGAEGPGQDAPAPRVVLAAVASPVIGSLGIAAYLGWANNAVSEIGGYFAAQERGWDSGFDAGAATLRWVGEHLFGPVSSGAAGEEATGYAIAGWSMVLVALLCVASVWALVARWIPWPVWLVAVLIAGMVLASDGIMHSRPRLLLLSVVLLALPFLVRIVEAVRGHLVAPEGGPGASRVVGIVGIAALVVTGVAWCALGIWVSGEMLIDFRYAI